MLLLECNGCPARVMTECSCPLDLSRTAHEPTCQHSNLDAMVTCAPDSGCCQESHDHGAKARACPGIPGDGDNHPGEPCPFPEGQCKSWISSTSSVAGKTDAGPCPGGHCAPGVDGCTVCRPITITFMGGISAMRPAPAAFPNGA